ncbi:TorF family putative porin [Asticcacaulis biprosthecium]|uniref:TorF family putative porin n=1 Tax=Asticcacaulis biprosthecium TaxID=76891 RepID=UPI0002DF6E3A|nr:TorF family putative porin [Asticcacaulis biprosthecium]
MKKIILAATAFAALAFAGSASAEGAVSYNIAVTSDYVFRGWTQTDGGPAIQGGADYSNGIFYAGAWASNVDFADYEVDLYAGVKPVVGAATFDLGVVTYQYGDDTLNATEAKAAVTYALPKGTIGAAYFYNIDFDDTAYYEVNASYPVTDKLTVSGAVGEQELAGLKYSTGNIGVTYAINSTLALDGRFSDTNIPEWFKPSGPRLAVTLKAAF